MTIFPQFCLDPSLTPNVLTLTLTLITNCFGLDVRLVQEEMFSTSEDSYGDRCRFGHISNRQRCSRLGKSCAAHVLLKMPFWLTTMVLYPVEKLIIAPIKYDLIFGMTWVHDVNLGMKLQKLPIASWIKKTLNAPFGISLSYAFLYMIRFWYLHSSMARCIGVEGIQML